MDKFSWIKDLVSADQQMEDAGIIDLNMGFDPECRLEDATVDFLNDLKLEFLKVISAFNQLSHSSLGPIRIYGIAKTKADFMLFRNGFKLIVSMRSGGVITISHHAGVTGHAPGQMGVTNDASPDILTAQVQAFGQLRWACNDQPVNLDYLIRHYVTRFVKSSLESRTAHGTEFP